MRTLNRAGWLCVGITLLLWGIAFTHYYGLEDPFLALGRMMASAFWGGIILAGVFTLLMAALFLSS